MQGREKISSIAAFFKNMVAYSIFSMIIFSITAVLTLVFAVKLVCDLPDADTVKRMSVENSISIDYKEMPEFLIKSAVAAMDPDYMKHKGIILEKCKNYLLNFYNGVKTYDDEGTITQKLARIILRKTNKSYEKNTDAISSLTDYIKEVALALKIEFKVKSKDKIMEIFMNNVSFGNNIYGVLQASTVYFNKKPSGLSSEECALLAAMIKEPEKNNPFTDKKSAKDGQISVLNKMKQSGALTEKQLLEIMSGKITLQPFISSKSTGSEAQYIEL